MHHAAPTLGLLLFPLVMLALLAIGIGLATIADASIWVPKRFGIGYTLDWINPLSWLLLGYIILIVFVILYGATHPHAPGISEFIEFLSRLAGSR